MKKENEPQEWWRRVVERMKKEREARERRERFYERHSKKLDAACNILADIIIVPCSFIVALAIAGHPIDKIIEFIAAGLKAWVR